MKLIYMIAADVLRALGWEVEINEKDSYWNLVLTNSSSSDDMPQSHKSCLRGLLRGYLMEFNYEGGHQQVNIYKELQGLDPEDDRYSCLDTCVKRTDSNTPVSKLVDREIFVRRKDHFDRYVLAEPVPENITTRPTAVHSAMDHVDEKPSAAECLEESIKQLGKAIRQFDIKASDLNGHMVQTPPKPIGYLEHEESKTRIPVFKRIGWFHCCMLRWCFGVKYTKED